MSDYEDYEDEDEVDSRVIPAFGKPSVVVAEDPEPFQFWEAERYSQGLEDTKALQEALAALPEASLTALNGVVGVNAPERVAAYVHFLNRCAALAVKVSSFDPAQLAYKAVAVDPGATRRMRVASANRRGKASIIQGPLVFKRRLPIPRSEKLSVIEVQFPAKNGPVYKVSAATPTLPEEAEPVVVAACQDFDYLEVWWVPNEVFVEPLKLPDPVVVGLIEHPFKQEPAAFSIYKWLEPTIESAYWASEGY